MKPNQIIKIPRLEDTFTQEKTGDTFSFRYSYARSSESRRENEPGQDYLTYAEQNRSFSFVLCDGVSQSFFGDIAAEILGDELLLWLNSHPLNADKEFLLGSLKTHLNKLTETASKFVQDHYIGTNTPAMIEEVLEEKRSLGSESMFMCGRIDGVSEELPRGRMILSWMGDGRIRIWNKKVEVTQELGLELNIDQRWSTKKGIVGGEPSLVISPILNRRGRFIYKRILAYTDGFGLLDQEKDRLSKNKLNEIINESLSMPENDDLSMIEITLD